MKFYTKNIDLRNFTCWFRKLILSVAIVFFVISCTSPLDIDTPRENIKIGGGKPFDVNISMIAFQENWHNRNVQIVSKSAKIDTSWTDPRLYLDLYLQFDELDIDDYNKLTVEDLRLTTDDLRMKQDPYYFKKSPIEINKAAFKIERGINISDEIEITADNRLNISEIAFNVDLTRQEIWAKFQSKIYNQVIEKKEKDTVVTTYVLEEKIDPVFDQYGNIIRYDTTEVLKGYPKDSTMIYMQETPDTLFLRGTIVFEW
jgi:hypothetical protein